MSDLKKKRGRKPKNYKQDIISKIDTEILSENENIILHLPITVNDLNTVHEPIDDLFIKNESDILVEKKIESEETDTIQMTNDIKTITNNINKVITHNLNFNKNTKCWWCRHSFNNQPTQLPEDYYNETFYCIGHFCSYNCAKAYNLELNDTNLWKRESLLQFMYLLTYSNNKTINPAPSWMTLIDYGGTLTIEQFRKSFVENTKDYLILHPPLISRQMQIEESYKINKSKNVPINNINKIYSEVDTDYILKRSKPIQMNHTNLELAMGLVRKKVK